MATTKRTTAASAKGKTGNKASTPAGTPKPKPEPTPVVPVDYSYTNFTSCVSVGEIRGEHTISLLLQKVEEIDPERVWRSQEEISSIFELEPTLSVIEFAAELADCGVAVESIGQNMYILKVFND